MNSIALTSPRHYEQRAQNSIAPVPGPSSRIDDEVRILRNTVGRLEDALNVLSKRLEPVRGAYSPSPPRAVEDKVGQSCPLSCLLEDIEWRVYAAVTTINAEVDALSI